MPTVNKTFPSLLIKSQTRNKEDSNKTESKKNECKYIS